MTNNPVTMSLEINDMVFKSILDNLYTDLPLAIVREICCNAVDSHLVARNYEPFLVQKPSECNPYFIVRDFGTGLSKENVYKYLICSTGGMKDKYLKDGIINILMLDRYLYISYMKKYFKKNKYLSLSNNLLEIKEMLYGLIKYEKNRL